MHVVHSVGFRSVLALGINTLLVLSFYVDALPNNLTTLFTIFSVTYTIFEGPKLDA